MFGFKIKSLFTTNLICVSGHVTNKEVKLNGLICSCDILLSFVINRIPLMFILSKLFHRIGNGVVKILRVQNEKPKASEVKFWGSSGDCWVLFKKYTHENGVLFIHNHVNINCYFLTLLIHLGFGNFLETFSQ